MKLNSTEYLSFTVCVSVGVTFCLLVAILLIILLVLKRKGNNRKSVEDGQEDVYRRKKISVGKQSIIKAMVKLT